MLLPDSGSLLTDGGSGASGSNAADAVGELQRVLRGQDLSQLRGYVGAPPPARPASGSDDDGSSTTGSNNGAAGEGSEVEEGTAMGGIRRYEPESGELVVLLSCKIGGKPAVGAELLAVAQAQDGKVVLALPDGWEQLLPAP